MVGIDSSKINDYQLIEVRGEIDASSSIKLDNAIKKASSASDKILIDLTGLNYISSAGLGVFISYLEELKIKNKKMVLFGLSENVREVFQILGLQHLIEITETKEKGEEILNEI